MQKNTKAQTDVLYNATCPVCSVETNHYARLSRKHGLPISFDDLNAACTLSKWGIDADAAAKRLHVQKEGKVYSGVPAFLALWQAMPGYRWLAKLISTPGVFHVSVWVYDFVLAPSLYRSHVRRREKASKA